MERSETPTSFSIYICPLQDQWTSGPIGSSLQKLSYFSKKWSLPHMTLTEYVPYDCQFTLEKILGDLKKILESSDTKNFDFGEYLKKAEVIESVDLYLVIFDKVPLFEHFFKKLLEIGYMVKSKKFHITLGKIKEIQKVDEIKKEVEDSLLNEKLSQALKEYFEKLEWTLSVLNLNEFPAKVEAQIKIKI